MKAFLLVSFLISLTAVLAGRPCGSSTVCHKNYDFITSRRERDDYSVHKDSYYMFIDEFTFEDLVTIHGLDYSHVNHPPAPFKPTEGPIDQLVKEGETAKNPILVESLSSTLGDENDIVPNNKNNYFVVYGIVDLINLEYTRNFYDQTKIVYKFSTQEVIDNLDEEQLIDIGEVIRYIDQNGLCLEEEYKSGSCSQRYYIESFDKINDFTNQGIYKALQKSALYVQVGLNPKFFQFHEPGCEHAIHAGHDRPTYAGVLTGIQLSLENDVLTGNEYTPDGYEFWEMYIRRHGNGYNYVRLNCTLQKWNKTTGALEWNQPFAGLASKMYRVVVPGKLTNQPITITSTSGETMDNNQLIEAIENAIENANSPDSEVDTSTIVIDSTALDCMGNNYNLTSINGISNIIIDNPLCIIDTTGTLTFTDSIIRRLEETAPAVTELNYIGLSIRAITFGTNTFQDRLFRIRIENCLHLKTLHFGDNSLSMTQSLSIGNNPNLISLIFGQNALSYISYFHTDYYTESEFKFFDLPGLKRLEFHDDCMKNFAAVTANNVAVDEDLYLVGGVAFKGMQTYTSENVHEEIDTYFKGIEIIPDVPEPVIKDRKGKIHIINPKQSIAFKITDMETNQVFFSVNKNFEFSNTAEEIVDLVFNSTSYKLEILGDRESWLGCYLFIKIEIGNGEYETILRSAFSTKPELFTNVHIFNFDYPVASNSLWHYSNVQQTGSEWLSLGSYLGWNKYSIGSFPESSSPIKYYAKQFTVAEGDLNNVPAFMLSVRFKYGCVVMMNGFEVYRRNVVGDLTTLALSESAVYDTNRFYQSSFPVGMYSDGAYNDYIKEGNNIILIILVNTADEPNIEFDCSIRLLNNEGFKNRIIDYSIKDMNSGLKNVDTAFDHKLNNENGIKGDSSRKDNYLEISFNNDRREWINYLSIMTWDRNNVINSITLKAKNPEDSEYTVLVDNHSLTWGSDNEQKIIPLTNIHPYNTYRFEFYRNNANIWYLQEITLFQKYYDNSINTLTYPALNFIPKAFNNNPYSPLVDVYTNFKSSNLPEGCTISYYYGEIDCTQRQESFHDKVTITASHLNGQEQSFEFDLTIEDCPYPLTTINLVVEDEGKGNVLEIYDGETLVDAVTFNSLFKGDRNYCLAPRIHTLKYYRSTYILYFTNNEGLNLFVDDRKFRIYSIRPGYHEPYYTYKFDPTLVVKTDSEWKSFTAVATNWNAVNFDDSAWSESVPSSITTEATTVYLRKEFIIPSLSTHHVLNVQVNFIGGVVGYFNGQKVARFNLDENLNVMTPKTSATTSSFSVILSNYGVTTEKNILAFEVHSDSTGFHSVEFSATAVFGVDECSHLTYSTPSISYGNVDNPMPSYSTYLFDGNVNNKLYNSASPNTEMNMYLSWSFDNLEGATFNTFGIISASRASMYCDFSVDGFDKTTNMFTPLFNVYDHACEGSVEILDNYLPNGLTTERNFRIYQQHQCGNGFFKLSELYLAYCVDPSCAAEGEYPAAMNRQNSTISCGAGFTGYKSRLCSNGVFGEEVNTCVYANKLNYNSENYFIVLANEEFTSATPSTLITPTSFSITPELPEGLILRDNGVISGTVTAAFAETAFTVTVVDAHGSATVTLRLIGLASNLFAVTKGAAVTGGSVSADTTITSELYDFYSLDRDTEYTIVNQAGAVVISPTNEIWKYNIPSFKEVIDSLRDFDTLKTDLRPADIAYTITADDLFTHYRNRVVNNECPEGKEYVYTYVGSSDNNKQHFCVTPNASYFITSSPSAVVMNKNGESIESYDFQKPFYKYTIPSTSE